MSTTTIEHTIDTADGLKNIWVNSLEPQDVKYTTHIFRTLNLAQVDGFHQARCSGQNTGVEDTASSRNDLATTTMDSISVQGDIMNVKSNTTHVFVTEDTLLGSPLETGNNRILDFV